MTVKVKPTEKIFCKPLSTAQGRKDTTTAKHAKIRPSDAILSTKRQTTRQDDKSGLNRNSEKPRRDTFFSGFSSLLATR